MLMAGEREVIVIMSAEQDLSSWLPIYPILKKTAAAKLDEYSESPVVSDYLKKAEDCPYYIHGYNNAYFIEKTNPKSKTSEFYSFTSKAHDAYGYNIATSSVIKNSARQIIGCTLRFQVHFGKKFSMEYLRWEYEGSYVSGPITFLPPPTKVTAEEAIDGMINLFMGSEPMETPPSWEQKIDLPGLADLETHIAQREKQRSLLGKEIEELKRKMDGIIKLRRLLWADSGLLENAVKDAFAILEFSEIRKIRPPNLEDWIIDFKHFNKLKHGVFEIKGAEKRTSMADLTQCNKWVEDYLLENIKVKGIFVTNQYRHMDIATSLEKREEFAPNELEYAQKREICILPSHEIFNAIIEKMKGNKEVTRKVIEEKIISASGLCKLI